MKKIVVLFAAVAVVLATGAMAQATVITHVATPDQVPDETLPRGNFGDAPAGFGPNSWQGPEAGLQNKTNWHARYGSDGNYLSVLFPDDAATLKVSDLKSISYFTNRPDGTAAGQDWWIQVYTRPTTVNDEKTWYHDKFTNNYNEHSETGAWTQYSTDGSMTFNDDGSATEMTLSELQNAEIRGGLVGDQFIEMISVQTNSGWNGFDGYIDGLRIELQNGNVGIVNFEAVPEPASLVMWGLLGVAGLCGVTGRRRKR
jgi:hypothetical protein